jgi:hypothetical protein
MRLDTTRAGLLALLLLTCAGRASGDELDVAALPEPLREGARDIAAVWKMHPDDPSVLYQVAAIFARAGRRAGGRARSER